MSVGSVGAKDTKPATVAFRDITTIGVGGPIHKFLEPSTPDELIDSVSHADSEHLPLCVIGGGSNLLVGDAPFPGVVVRYAARDIHTVEPISLERTGVSSRVTAADAGLMRLRVEAGCNWDDFVFHTIELGLNGVEGLSGIPGTVGASVVQNIGAYGQEVASSVESVEVWDRLERQLSVLHPADLGFGYRTSALKRSMIEPDGSHDRRWYPTPRFVVSEVTFRLHRGSTGTIGYEQLAHALGLSLGDTAETRDIRAAVLRVRAAKGMLEDAHRYENPAMRGMKDAAAVAAAIRAQDAEETDSGSGDASSHDRQRSAQERTRIHMDTGEGHHFSVIDYRSSALRSNRHSCGSFFINPIMSPEQAASLPAEAPKFSATLTGGAPGVKTSAAWLIDHAGFHRGFRLDPHAPAGLSTRHTLALVNRGDARSDDVAALARRIQCGVHERFGVFLMPEPVIFGLRL